MTLGKCVKGVLCGLSAATRNALALILKKYVTELQLYEQALEAEAIYLNALAIVPNILNKEVQAVIRAARSALDLVPLSLIGNCFDMQDLNRSVQVSLDLALAEAKIISQDLERLLSAGDEVQIRLDEVRVTIQTYAEALALIDACALIDNGLSELGLG